jgi:TetR/AcrR family transcriptional repressor of mexCD-oprJ operon
VGIPEQGGRRALQERIAGAILEAAARTLAQSGGKASMSDVATEAGVARATLYRYFPSREALVEEVARLAATGAGERLQSARLGEVSVEEGVARAVRAMVEVGDLFVVLARERIRPDPEVFESSLGSPLRGLIERGQGMGSIRGDAPSTWLTESLIGLVVSVLSANPAMGREDTIDLTASLFLEGASRSRSDVE